MKNITFELQSPLGYTFQKHAIQRIIKSLVYIPRNASQRSHIHHIDIEKLKQYIITEGYGK